jgi:hypothetical protein
MTMPELPSNGNHSAMFELQQPRPRARREVTQALERIWALKLPRDQQLERLHGDACAALELLQRALAGRG